MDAALHKKIYLALLGNVVPFVGVVFFHWSVVAILLSYWLENVVIGLYQILKIKKAKLNYPVNEQNKFVIGPLRPVKSSEQIFYSIFFSVHYGIFLFGHLAVLSLFAEILSESIKFTWAIVMTSLPFFLTHGKSYVEEYIGEKQYEKIPLIKFFVGPYRRIFVMHITLILGAIPLLFVAKIFPQISFVVIVLKIFLDVFLKEKEFAFWKKFEEVK